MAVAERAGNFPHDATSRTSGRVHWRVAWLEVALSAGLFVSLLTVYLLTLSPGLSFNSIDGNELTTVPYILGLAHSTGYPLFTWLGKAFTYLPIGDVAYRMN